MFEEFYRASPYISLATITPFFFIAFFAGVIAWVWLTKRERFDHASRLPLDDDDPKPAEAARTREP